MGAVTELGSDELHAVVAQAYLDASVKGQSALLVAPTWAEIEAVTERIREALKLSGKLVGEEKEVQVFDSLSWTEAQKRDARQYRPGTALRFHRSKGGFARGESVEVVTVGTDSLAVRCRDGSTAELRLSRGPAAFDTGESRTLRITAGDKLLLQSNAVTAGQRFINGELVEIKTVQGGDILLTDGRVIPEHYRTFTHGYTVTSHAAQGKTVDEVLVLASARSLPAVHQQQFYVSISRGRERCQVFTDDKDLLRSHVTHSSERLAAVEIVPHSRQNVIRRIMQRGHPSETVPPAHDAIPFAPREH
jgi:hypothetical protein